MKNYVSVLFSCLFYCQLMEAVTLQQVFGAFNEIGHVNPSPYLSTFTKKMIALNGKYYQIRNFYFEDTKKILQPTIRLEEFVVEKGLLLTPFQIIDNGYGPLETLHYVTEEGINLFICLREVLYEQWSNEKPKPVCPEHYPRGDDAISYGNKPNQAPVSLLSVIQANALLEKQTPSTLVSEATGQFLELGSRSYEIRYAYFEDPKHILDPDTTLLEYLRLNQLENMQSKTVDMDGVSLEMFYQRSLEATGGVAFFILLRAQDSLCHRF